MIDINFERAIFSIQHIYIYRFLEFTCGKSFGNRDKIESVSKRDKMSDRLAVGRLVTF